MLRRFTLNDEAFRIEIFRIIFLVFCYCRTHCDSCERCESKISYEFTFLPLFKHIL